MRAHTYFIVAPNVFMVLGYFLGFEHNHRHDHEQKNSSTPADKIGKIRSQLAKCNVFCGTEASSIISSVTQYRIAKNCDRLTLCSSHITIHYYGQEKNYNAVFLP